MIFPLEAGITVFYWSKVHLGIVTVPGITLWYGVVVFD